jgi:hypothetical protein
VPVLEQLEAAWTTLCALFRLASALPLQHPDSREVAQAGSLIFHSGQQALVHGLAAVRSPQAGRQLLVELARRAERQLTSAERFLDFLLCKKDQPADFRFSAGVAAMAAPPSAAAVWLAAVSKALQLAATILPKGESKPATGCPIWDGPRMQSLGRHAVCPTTARRRC